MICPPCRRGGELNAQAPNVTGEKTREWITLRATEAHGECWWDNCGCHHELGDFRSRRGDG